MTEVADAKVGIDSDDLTSKLVNADLEDDKLTSGDLASFFILLVVAGNETTRNAIGWGLKYLTDNPDQRKIWESDFDAVAPTAVEEIVRLASPVSYMRRTATRDAIIRGQEIKAGDKVCMFYLAANRDEEVFRILTSLMSFGSLITMLVLEGTDLISAWGHTLPDEK